MPDSPSPFFITADAYAPRLKRLRQLTKLLDKAITIPGTNVGIGLDPIIGLIPIGGDALGFILSLYIMIEAARLGVSKATLSRMAVNIMIDAFLGAVPMLGDVFDFAWTANSYNLQLLEDALKAPKEQKKADKWFIFGIVATLLVLMIVLVALPVIIISTVWHALTGG
jgi:hypothetical protein